MWWLFRRDQEKDVPTYLVENTIARGTAVQGDLRGPGGFRVDGRVEGSIDADGPVVIGPEGVVEGAVRGRDVVVLGRVHGDVRAAIHLEIGPKGRVVGDVLTQSLRLHKGGVFRGASRMVLDAEPAPANDISLPAPKKRVRTLPPPHDTAVPPPADPAELAGRASIDVARTHGAAQAIALPAPSRSEERLVTGVARAPSDAPRPPMDTKDMLGENARVLRAPVTATKKAAS